MLCFVKLTYIDLDQFNYTLDSIKTIVSYKKGWHEKKTNKKLSIKHVVYILE